MNWFLIRGEVGERHRDLPFGPEQIEGCGRALPGRCVMADR
jgi:hypothetical protein